MPQLFVFFICLQDLPRYTPISYFFDMYMKFKDLPIKISVFSSNGNVIKKEIGIMILTIIFFFKQLQVTNNH